MTSRRAFVAVGLGTLTTCALTGGCALGGYSDSGSETTFSIANRAGSTAIVRFDLGIQNTESSGLTERSSVGEVRVEAGETTGYNPVQTKVWELRRSADAEGGALVWQVQVRLLGPSWENPVVEWYELRSANAPVELVLQTMIRDDTGERSVLLRTDDAAVTRVPAEFWPETE